MWNSLNRVSVAKRLGIETYPCDIGTILAREQIRKRSAINDASACLVFAERFRHFSSTFGEAAINKDLLSIAPILYVVPSLRDQNLTFQTLGLRGIAQSSDDAEYAQQKPFLTSGQRSGRGLRSKDVRGARAVPCCK